MEDYVLRNFERYLQPLAGQGPHVCLHLGIQNPSHGAWLCQNLLCCVDDAYFGTCDFCGSGALYKTAVDLMAGFGNANIWPYPPAQFLWETPPMAVAALGNGGATLIYIDGSRDSAVFKDVLAGAWRVLRPGGLCLINGYRTGRRRHELYPVVDSFLMANHEWETVCQNRQCGFRKAK